LLPERDPHPAVYDALLAMLGDLAEPIRFAAEIARFELQLLAELGFGLDLTECAATGEESDLVYVSPKSGRAVSRDAGAPWRDRLFSLPAFLSESSNADPGVEDLAAAFRLTGYFLERRMFEPRGVPLPDARQNFIAAVLRERSTTAVSA
jgi:DNA repair protein RecO (recombination protein O)